MDNNILFCAGSSQATHHACDILSSNGINTFYEPCDATKYVLLDIPSLGPTNTLRGGEDLRNVLSAIPNNVTLIG